MEIGPEALNERVERFREMLSAAGVKLTHQRLEIFREVAKSADHPDAEAVFRGVRKRVPSVSLDTVYRTLWAMIDLGLLSTVGHSRERVRFDANMAAHHHFVCTRCGMMRDFRSEEFDRLGIPDAVRQYGSAQQVQVEIRGICTRCSGEATSKRCASRRKEERWKRKRS
jgi:Fur family peroxide stress response transcriptional regulator